MPDIWWMKIPLCRLTVALAIDPLPERRDLGLPWDQTGLYIYIL
jgi:hypothetical protein